MRREVIFRWWSVGGGHVEGRKRCSLVYGVLCQACWGDVTPLWGQVVSCRGVISQHCLVGELR